MKLEMTTENKYYFYLGYCRRSAELLKEEGLFKDLTIEEVMIKLTEGAVNNV